MGMQLDTDTAGQASQEKVPLVTILMASYGRLNLLKQSLASALAQDYGHFEVVIVDDGSDEETKQWLREAHAENDRVRVVFQDHQGVAVARARGVAEARGDYVCILDSDDQLLPYALTRLTAAISAAPNCALVYSPIREIHPNGQIIVPGYKAFSSATDMLWATLRNPRVPFKHSGTLFDRKAAVELGSYDVSLPCKIDIDFFLKFMAAGYCPRLLDAPIIEFRIHKNSISRNRWVGIRVWFGLIDRYGPRNPLTRLYLKFFRGLSETFKLVYVQIAG